MTDGTDEVTNAVILERVDNLTLMVKTGFIRMNSRVDDHESRIRYVEQHGFGFEPRVKDLEKEIDTLRKSSNLKDALTGLAAIAAAILGLSNK